MMQQGLHHQQQQLVALLNAALPKDSRPPTPSTTTNAPATTTAGNPPSEDEESSRVAAINQLHRAVLYPPNSLLLTHSASFLAQGFSQLLSDKSYIVRQTAAKAYGALCSVLCSIPITSNGRQNHIVLGGFVDRFIGWALPLLRNIGDGTAELALEGLREFLNVGDAGATERYAQPILKACQELIEDERTSMNLVRRLLSVLTLISLKFFRCFQPHFVDIVDLLLGWAMVPDLSESDRRVIMDSFLRFQKHWVNNMQFSLGLLSKFLGDMDVLLHDGNNGTPQQFQRLIALLSCFSTVLQSVASGLLEINLLEQISEPLCKMVPLLLQCLSSVGRKFGWSLWLEDLWRCLTLLAEILSEKFSTFYPTAVDILFQSLEMGSKVQPVGPKKITSFQVHGVLKTNLQLLSLQKLGLLASFIHKILQFDAPVSQLRLHPNRLVSGSSTATYIYLLQHGNSEIVEQTVNSITGELELLKIMLVEVSSKRDGICKIAACKSYSKTELFALIKFDLKVLLSCVSLGGSNTLIGPAEINELYVSRSEKLLSFITQSFDPFDLPIESHVELQFSVLETVERLAAVQFLVKAAMKNLISGEVSSETVAKEGKSWDGLPMIVFEHLRKYSVFITKALRTSSPLAIKVQALQWTYRFCETVINEYERWVVTYYPCEVVGYVDTSRGLLLSILDAASDREQNVRSHVASLLKVLIQAKLVHPVYFPVIAERVLEKLGDPDREIKAAFVKLLSDVLPITVYVCGLYDNGTFTLCNAGSLIYTNNICMNWKLLFALKQLPQQLRSQQLVSILSYISQRWKVPLSSWIQRLICACQSSKYPSPSQVEETGDQGANGLWWDVKVDEDILEKVTLTSVLAGAWWAIHEAARYCISTRLRTNLGGPTQTFAALERMLLDVAHVLQLDADQSDGNLSIIGSSYAHLLPMRLLLEFVEALKKNVYNAYEGSIVLPHASRQSSLFFRANRKVCEEWFSRICEPMMNAGLALHCHDATIHYCTLRLQELGNIVSSALVAKSRAQVMENLENIRGRISGDIVRILRHVALALCKKHEAEALRGIQRWASFIFSPLFTGENQSPGDGRILAHFSWITGLTYQAEGQHEKAAAYFINLLQTEESLSLLDSDGVQFVIARIIESYTAVSDWNSLDSWLMELQTLRAKHAGKTYAGALTTAGNEISSVQALARFDEGEYQAAWACLNLTPKSSGEFTLDPKLALHRSEQMLLQALLLKAEGKLDRESHELLKAKSMLEETLSVLPLDGLVDAAPFANQLYCISVVEESCKAAGNQENNLHLHSLLGSYIQSVESPMKRVLQDCNLWLKVLRTYKLIHPLSSLTFKICKNISSLARKQRNFELANRLNNYLKDHVSSCSDRSLFDSIIPDLQYESILLSHAESKLEDAFTNLWVFLRPSVISSSLMVSDPHDNVLKAKACLKLAKWLQQSASDLNLEHVILKMRADFEKPGASLLEKETVSLTDVTLSSKDNMNAVVEELVGTAKKVACHLCPRMAKSWISYATWCLNYARAFVSASSAEGVPLCSFSPALASEFQHERFSLTDKEQSKVKDVISRLLQKGSVANYLDKIPGDGGNAAYSSEFEENEDYLKPLMLKVVSIIEAAAQAPGAEDSNGQRLSDALTSQLQNCLRCANTSLDEATMLLLLGDLVDVWWSLRRRRVSLFGNAAQGFINYLSYSSCKTVDDQLSGFGGQSKKSTSYTLRALLFVLHILLNYGLELGEILEPALSGVPLLPWQEITPQLFARLCSHPEQAVRNQLKNLLVMLAKLSPWSIVYPTLVNANAYERETPEELQHILACLNELYPRLVRDVQLMIKELENVTVLWEELWLSTLQDLHSDVMRRINLLKDEAARIAESTTLSYSEKNKINAAKYSAMMAPVIVVLERRLASTSRKPQTPHETWFHQEYEEQIKSAIKNFKNPPSSASDLGEVWRPFNNIAASLASYQRKSLVALREVAPNLAMLSSSEAPMPGLEKQMTLPESGNSVSIQRGIVTISSFSEYITILSTKTKPKKIVLIGSDGQKYTFLLKGREDLRLDARIMQLLQAVNGFLHSSYVTHGQSLVIRYYSVTPISGRAGLIQWVDNVVSVYSVFKSWQTRVQLAQLSGLAAGNINSEVPPPVPRPSDMFYGKIIPALKEKGIRRVISRRDWPHEVKRKVLVDLMKETPKQLLHQEIWCASEGFKAFSSKLSRYCGSLAAMSMVGHILGLGDRHLDNILIDFCTGDIVHIDYNVCFDKGQRLKIPEIVPFRLTQTIETALGLTGIEGTFRANCEAVLSLLKKNKDVILMLLEVFVWDPLVEWTRGDFHDDAAIVGEERKGMELAVSLSLFASRVQEIRVLLQEHHDLLLDTLPTIESALERFAAILSQYDTISSMFSRADQVRSSLVLHEASVKSIVAEASSNSERTRASFEIQAREFTQAKAFVMEKAQEATTWIEQHGRMLDALRSNSLPEKASVFVSGKEALSLLSAVLAAGIPVTVVPEPTQAQCHEIDGEVSQLVVELDNGLSAAVQALQSYSMALQHILPLNYLSTSPIHGWAQVMRLSVSTVSSDILSLAIRQAAELIATVQSSDLDSAKNSYDDLCLKVGTYAAEIERVEKESAELANSIGPETELRAKDRLLSAFVNMKSSGLSMNDDAVDSGSVKNEGLKDVILKEETEQRKANIIPVVHAAVINIYKDVKHRVSTSLINANLDGTADTWTQYDFTNIFCNFEEQIEKCVVVAGFLDELQHIIGTDVNVDTDVDHLQRNWASIFKNSILSCKHVIDHMTEIVLPDIVRSVISFNSEVMDAFGSLSHIRGTVDAAMEQLVEVELERASLYELEQTYFVKVGLITEQQLALEEAAVKGRDHLSWEEADELASQEEACSAELDRLHQAWNQKDLRSTSLATKETNVTSALMSSELHLQSIVTAELEREPRLSRSKSILAALVQPFSELESIDQALSSFAGAALSTSSRSSNIADLVNSGGLISEYVWKTPGILGGHAFFIWKISVLDSFLDSCIHDTASSVDQNINFDQLVNAVKEKLETQLWERIVQYLRDRVAPVLLARLEREIGTIKQTMESSESLILEPVKQEFGTAKRVQHMLEEYYSAHETVRAARSAASVMERQVNELKEALQKASLEIVQMEWMHDNALSTFQTNRLTLHRFFPNDNILLPVLLKISRPQLLESMKSSIAKIAASLECLQACEQTSTVAEGQLERAMGWACGGPNSTAAGNSLGRNSRIPSEFHDHLIKRRQLLWEAREKASDIVKACISVLEFEASREGIFRTAGEVNQSSTSYDGRTWQQTYLNALRRLDVAYRAFTRTEQEWQLAQSNMEAASSRLFSATSELSLASLKVKSSSGDLQNILLAMRDCAYETSVTLSAFGNIIRGHTALTSESGGMLEEVLAITEGLHDVHSLAKEAGAFHSSLIEDLSKANAILLPLEAVLSKDVAAMTDAMAKEKETKLEISPVHGQAIFQSYYTRIQEACQALNPLVPSLVQSIKGLYSKLIRLARTASLHAGNLHKALEGLGESQDIRTEDTDSRPDPAGHANIYSNKESEILSNDDGEDYEIELAENGLSSEDRGWFSPPESVHSGSSESDVTSSEATLVGSSSSPEAVDTLLYDPNSKEPKDFLQHSPSTGNVFQEVSSLGQPDFRSTQVKLVEKDEMSLSRKDKIEDEIHGTSCFNADPAVVKKGKNAYAISILKRVEAKLDGRDICDNREISVTEQVDFLLKQATSLDNLCNMYEGWTPWI